MIRELGDWFFVESREAGSSGSIRIISRYRGGLGDIVYGFSYLVSGFRASWFVVLIYTFIIKVVDN